MLVAKSRLAQKLCNRGTNPNQLCKLPESSNLSQFCRWDLKDKPKRLSSTRLLTHQEDKETLSRLTIKLNRLSTNKGKLMPKLQPLQLSKRRAQQEPNWRSNHQKLPLLLLIPTKSRHRNRWSKVFRPAQWMSSRCKVNLKTRWHLIK